MHHRWDVDLGLEDVQIGVDEPPASRKDAEGGDQVLASCLAGLSHGPADPEISDLTSKGKSSKTKIN